MAEVYRLPGASEPAAVAPPIAVEGWDFDAEDSDPPVIINPSATPQARAAWALGQMQQLGTLLDAIGQSSGGTGVNAALVAGAANHFSRQIVAVLTELSASLRTWD
ncbi:MAG: hypothetical protein KGN16_01060 [Burkholderiales bacterium]|nr:hypothetical protein [Burkholderiales bacterium]